jgi:hypothetical protein
VLIVIGAVSEANIFSVGFAYQTGGRLVNTLAAMNSYALESSYIIRLHSGYASDQAVVKSMDSDGFTLTWEMEVSGVAATATCHYLAFR